MVVATIIIIIIITVVVGGVIAIIIIILSVELSLLTVCQFSFLFSFCKAHHQREESIQRLYLHRARLNDDKYLLSEEERVRFFNYLFYMMSSHYKCSWLTPSVPIGRGGGWIFQLLIQIVVNGFLVASN